MASQLNTNEVEILYNDVLFRGADPGGLSFWASGLDAGTYTLAQVTNAFMTSAEAQGLVDPVIRLYEGVLGRAPDAPGLAYWLQQAENGTSLQSIAQSFMGSAEFSADYGSSANPSAFLNALYSNVLGRSADAGGMAYWLGVLGATPTASSEATVLLDFVKSAEFIGDTQSGIDAWLTHAVSGAQAGTTATSLGTVTYSSTLLPFYANGYTIGAIAIAAADATNSPITLQLPASGDVTVNVQSTLAVNDPSGINLAGNANTTVDYSSNGAGARETLTFSGSGNHVVNFTGTAALPVNGDSIVGGTGTTTVNATNVTLAAGESWIGGAGSGNVMNAYGADNFSAGYLTQFKSVTVYSTVTFNATEAAGFASIAGSADGVASLTIVGDGTTSMVNLTGELSGIKSLTIDTNGHAVQVTLGASDLSGVTSVTEVGGGGTITTTVAGAEALLAINPGLTYALSDTAVNIGAASGYVLSHSTNYSPPPAPPPAPRPSTITLTVPGETIALTGATGSITLSGADLTSYPASRYGTVALAASSGATTVNSTSNDTLSAAGNAGATSYNFGTGVVSGVDSVDATLKYTGFTNYIASNHGDTVTLSAATQNVTGGTGGDTVNLGALAYAGTLAFSSAGADSVHVTIGGDISGGAITSGGATVGLVLSGAGTETLNTAEYNLFNAASITGGTFGGNTIVFSNAGTVTANANVGNYDLSTAGNTITLTNVADNVTGGASGSNTVNLGALAYTGAMSFGASGADSVHVTIGGDISGGAITSGGATVGLVLSGAGTETLNTAEYNLFNAASITGGTFGGDTIAFSDAGTVTANANVGNYDLSTAGNTITLTNVADNVTGGSTGNDIVAIPQRLFTGTLAFGTTGTDIVQAPTNGDFSGLTVTSSGATLELMITGVVPGTPSGSSTTTEIYNEFTTGPHAGGIVFPAGGDTNPADYFMTFDNQGTVTDSANISNYDLCAAIYSTTNDIYTFTIAHNSADVIAEFAAATGGSTYNIEVPTFTGSLSVGSSGTDTINVAAGSDISGGQLASSGTTVDLHIVGSGTVTVSLAEAALFHAAPSAIVASGADTMNIANSTSPINLNAQENALTTVGLQASGYTVNVSIGAASVNAGAAGFNQTISENGIGGYNVFNIDNGAAAIIGAADATHYVTINNFNTASDNINLTLSGAAQNSGEQNISDSGNDTITVGANGVIVEEDLGALPGFTVFNATDLSSAQANMLRAINASASTSGEYTFVIDTNQGAGIYEIHVNSGANTIDGIQLIGVVHGVGAFNLINHVS